MATLPALRGVSDLRVRRWDAIVLGSGIPALVAAARLGMGGRRILVVQEEAAVQGFAGLREPFALLGGRDEGALDACLRALTLPLIERRRLEPSPVALQVLGPERRLDLGAVGAAADDDGQRNLDELVAWALAKPDPARRWLQAMGERSEAERNRLLASPIVRSGRALGRSLATGTAAAPGAVNAAVEAPTPELATLCTGLARALSSLADSAPLPEARTRTLGSLLAGASRFAGGPPWLAGLLRRRIEALYGEFRTLARPFRLVAWDGQAGVAPQDSKDLWLGRALVVACPGGALAQALEPADRPGFLSTAATRGKRRTTLHLRVRREVVPEAMAERALWLDQDSDEFSATNPVTIARFPNPQDAHSEDWVVRALPPEGMESSAVEEALVERIRRLLPFSEGALERRPIQNPRWDDDDWLEDPEPGHGWPRECELRVSSRPPVYRLDRSGIAGLGLEGDLLLGWRGGDAVAADLTPR